MRVDKNWIFEENKVVQQFKMDLWHFGMIVRQFRVFMRQIGMILNSSEWLCENWEYGNNCATVRNSCVAARNGCTTDRNSSAIVCLFNLSKLVVRHLAMVVRQKRVDPPFEIVVRQFKLIVRKNNCVLIQNECATYKIDV